jgi:hypothetical protein
VCVVLEVCGAQAGSSVRPECWWVVLVCPGLAPAGVVSGVGSAARSAVAVGVSRPGGLAPQAHPTTQIGQTQQTHTLMPAGRRSLNVDNTTHEKRCNTTQLDTPVNRWAKPKLTQSHRKPLRHNHTRPHS